MRKSWRSGGVVIAGSTAKTGSPAKDTLFLMDYQKRVHVFDTDKGTLGKKLAIDWQTGRPQHSAYLSHQHAPDNRTLFVMLTSGFRGAIWDVKSNSASALLPFLQQQPFHGRPRTVVFSSDGRYGAAESNGKIALWNGKTGEPILAINSPGAVRLAIVPDANVLVANIAGADQLSQLVAWSVATGNEIWRDKELQTIDLIQPIPKSKRIAYVNGSDLVIRDCGVKAQTHIVGKPSSALPKSPSPATASIWRQSATIKRLPSGGSRPPVGKKP